MNTLDEKYQEAYNSFDKDLSEAIDRLNEEIHELQAKREMLVHQDFSCISEKQFHEMCETDLRYTDFLAKVIGINFQIEFKERTPSYYYYHLLNNWELRIPIFRKNGIEIIVPKYFKKDIRTDSDYLRYEESKRESAEKVGMIESLFFEGNLLSKARCVYGRKYKKTLLGNLVCIINYMITNPFLKYKKRFSVILEDLQERNKNASDRLSKYIKESEEGYKVQSDLIKSYLKFLDWTDEIRIYQRYYQTPSEIISKGTSK